MKTIAVPGTTYRAFDYVSVLGRMNQSLPYSLRVLAENALRHDETLEVVPHIVRRSGGAVPFRPSRLLLQDMLGVPLLVDMMAMRSRLADAGVNSSKIDMSLPVDLVIDHSMTVSYWAEKLALLKEPKTRI